ncbi:MAG: presqualene diphosphate synthase HpnD [Pseudomonadota bacterium]
MSAEALPVAVQVRRAGSTFYWAMRLMPRQRREAMFAIYALARELDDIADGPHAAAEKRRALEAWRDEIDAVYRGAPARLLGRALLAAVRRYRLPRAEFEELIRGMEMDVAGPLIAPPLSELELYCRRVAGAIGLLSLPVFGCDGPSAREFALHLGGALQMTNILRDVAEDAANGRLYLPREMLDKAGIATTDPRSVAGHPALAVACAALAAHAERQFAAAAEALAACDRRALRPALIMMVLYRRLLDKIRSEGWPAARRVRLGAAIRLGVALRVTLLARP